MQHTRSTLAVLAGLSFFALPMRALAIDYYYELGDLTFGDGSNFLTVPATFSGTGATARGYYVSGNWSAGPGDPWSNEFRVEVFTPSNASLGITSQGGLANGSAVSFPNIGGRNNTAAQFSILNGAPVDGTWSVDLWQAFAGSSANLADAQFHLLTDAQAPQDLSLSTSNPTYNRPLSLTSLSSVGTAVPYVVSDLTVATTGTYMIATKYASWDGFVSVYDTTFNAGSPLTNLIGVDDDGTEYDGDPFIASEMLLTLEAGKTYKVVTSTYGNTDPAGAFTLYVAGGEAVPEPATLLALGAGVAALAARRRRK